MKRRSIVVLISGSGSNLQAIIDAISAGQIDASITCVISNRPGAGGLQRAEAAGIPTRVVDHHQYEDRESFDLRLMAAIDEHDPDLIVLAGFMRILTTGFIHHYAGRILNIHPSLLPDYKGLHTHRRVLEDGGKRHGASVHFVSDELDSGSVVIRASVDVEPDDDEERLAARVLEKEHIIYPIAIGWFIEGRIDQQEHHARFDGAPIIEPALLEDGSLREPIC